MEINRVPINNWSLALALKSLNSGATLPQSELLGVISKHGASIEIFETRFMRKLSSNCFFELTL